MSLTVPAKLRNLELPDLGIYGVLVSVAMGIGMIGLEAHGVDDFLGSRIVGPWVGDGSFGVLAEDRAGAVRSCVALCATPTEGSGQEQGVCETLRTFVPDPG